MTSVLAAPGLSQPQTLKQLMDGSHHSHHIRHAHLAGNHQQQQQHSVYSSSGAVGHQTDLLSPHRPTSAPPDLELNSTNVFAFGLNSFSFRKESANQLSNQPTAATHPCPTPLLVRCH